MKNIIKIIETSGVQNTPPVIYYLNLKDILSVSKTETNRNFLPLSELDPCIQLQVKSINDPLFIFPEENIDIFLENFLIKWDEALNS